MEHFISKKSLTVQEICWIVHLHIITFETMNPHSVKSCASLLELNLENEAV
jgi:hypothetical protein